MSPRELLVVTMSHIRGHSTFHDAKKANFFQLCKISCIICKWMILTPLKMVVQILYSMWNTKQSHSLQYNILCSHAKLRQEAEDPPRAQHGHCPFSLVLRLDLNMNRQERRPATNIQYMPWKKLVSWYVAAYDHVGLYLYISSACLDTSVYV